MSDIITLSHSDAQWLADLHAQCFRKSWSQDEFAHMLARIHIFGFATAQKTCFILCQKLADEAEILTLATAQHAQRQGHARHVLTESLDQCRKMAITVLHLEVAENNKAAHALYVSCGFYESGRRKNYYEKQDALLLKYDIGMGYVG